MSMLAEPKKKIKWGLNSRGNFWANDDLKFGQKLLEKMGWQKGKGLGKHEDGMTNSITPSSQGNNKGLGWEDNNAWVPHQDHYNTLLQELNEKHSTNNLPKTENEIYSETSSGKEMSKSLEVRSKTLKSHIHYKKFVRGKDVSQYSVEELGCIFGKKTNDKDNDNDSCNSSPLKNNDKAKENSPKSEDTLLYTSSSSMADYFADKMKTLKAKPLEQSVMETSETSKKKSSKSHKSKKRKILEQEDSDEDKCNIEVQEQKSSLPKADDDESFVIDITDANTNTEGRSFKKRRKDDFATLHKNEQIVEVESSSNDSVVFIPLCSTDKSVKLSANSSTKNLHSECTVLPNSSCADVKRETNLKTVSITSKLNKTPTERLADALLLSKYSRLTRKLIDNPTNAANKFIHNTENWVVILKMARKQSRYKSLCENFGKDEVLSTTNLLDIPGYGTMLSH